MCEIPTQVNSQLAALSTADQRQSAIDNLTHAAVHAQPTRDTNRYHLLNVNTKATPLTTAVQTLRDRLLSVSPRPVIVLS